MTNGKQEKTGRSARLLSINIGNYTIIILIFVLFLGLSLFTKTFCSSFKTFSAVKKIRGEVKQTKTRTFPRLIANLGLS